MALPSSGRMRLGSDVNVELGNSATAQIALGQASVRSLYGVASGAIRLAADGYGKSNRPAISYTFTTSAANASLNITTLGGYSAGKSDVTVTVNAGVYLWASTTSNHGLSLTGGSSGDVITLVNNGYIIGCGGNANANSNGSAGGPALSLGFNIRLTNNSYIAGGGGGGATGNNGNTTGGGGGAGGGNGATVTNQGCVGAPGTGGAGGSAGNVGGSGGTGVSCGSPGYGEAGGGGGGGAGGGAGGGSSNSCWVAGGGGGGGGRQLPGSGGGGGWGNNSGNGGGPGANGGGSNNAGDAGFTSGSIVNSGGGGGWGASGGAVPGFRSGGAGGKAINLNTRSITFLVTGTIWGAIS